MNPIPNALDGNRRDIDLDSTDDGDESTLKENPEGGTKSIKPLVKDDYDTILSHYNKLTI